MMTALSKQASEAKMTEANFGGVLQVVAVTMTISKCGNVLQKVTLTTPYGRRTLAVLRAFFDDRSPNGAILFLNKKRKQLIRLRTLQLLKYYISL